MKVFILICFFCFSLYAQQTSHEDFARHVYEYLFRDKTENKNFQDQELFELLKQKGIEPKGGFQAGKELDAEEAVQLFGKLISNDNNARQSVIKAFSSKYRNRITVLKINGNVQIQYSGKDKWEPAGLDFQLSEADKIRTSEKASALLKVGTLGNVFLKENSTLDLVKLKVLKDGINEDIHLHLDKGKMVVNVQGMSKQSGFKTSTPSTLVAVRGTIYEVSADEQINR